MKNMHSTRPFEAVSNVWDLKVGCPGVISKKSRFLSIDFERVSNEFSIKVSNSLACSDE